MYKVYKDKTENLCQNGAMEKTVKNNQKDVKERIKQTVSIADLLNSCYGISFNGGGRGPCPLCNYQKDKKVFWISTVEQRFHCHHCKTGGDVFDLVMSVDNLSFVEALKKLAEFAGLPLILEPGQQKQYETERIKTAALLRFVTHWNERLTPGALQYLESRKINRQYIYSRLIGFIPDGASYNTSETDYPHLKKMGLMASRTAVKSKWCNRLFFPFWKNGQVFYFSGRAIDRGVKPGRLFPKVEEIGNKPEIGNPLGDSVVIVEGEFDFFTADQDKSFKSVMAILGESRAFELPGRVKTVDLLFDWDSAGDKHVEKHGLHFSERGKTVNVVTRPLDLPDDKNDLNDYFCYGGSIKDLSKISLPEWYINRLKNSPDNPTLKEQFFTTILPLGDIERDKYLTALHARIYKSQGVDKRSIKRDFFTFGKEHAQKSAGYMNSFIDELSGKELVLPEGYAFNGDRLVSTTKGETIAEKKIYISRLLFDPLENETHAQIISYYNGQQISSIEPIDVISNKKDIVRLSRRNFPITSENAGKVTDYIYNFRYANETVLKLLTASKQLGWNRESFLFPDRAVNWKGEIEQGFFIGNDPAKDVFTSKGDLNVYLDFIRDIKDDLGGDRWIIPVFVIYAALASFIIEILGSKVIIIHFTEDTGRGKTSLMELVASVYGKPNYHNSWDDTEVGLIRKAIKLKNFPLLINEGSIVDQKKGLVKFLYALSEGQSRSKAIKDTDSDTTPIKRFYNVVFSNGENSLLTGREPSGVLMRVNELFETLGGINHGFIDKLERTISNNYGLLIEPFLKKVINLRDGRTSIKVKLKDGAVRDVSSLNGFPSYESLDTSNGKHSGNINRKLKSFQPVYIAGCIAEDLFDFGYDPAEIIRHIYQLIKNNILNNINRAERVIEGVKEFYLENRSNFIDITTFKGYSQSESEEIKKAVNRGIKIYGYRKGRALLIIPGIFRNQILKSVTGSDGKNANVILKELKTERYIETDKDRNQKNTKIAGENQRVTYFPKFFDNDSEFESTGFQDYQLDFEMSNESSYSEELF